MLESSPRVIKSASVRSQLSPRERQVLHEISLGMTNRQVAENLAVSVHAIKFHLASIYRKLNVANRTEAAALFVRESLEDRIHN